MSGLTTHVLDLVAGVPAAAIAVRVGVRAGSGEDASWSMRPWTRTGPDGRARLLEAAELAEASYRLEFEVAAYFRDTGAATREPAFLQTVVIDFTVADPGQHHHIPLLVSPYGYSTYKGG